MSFSDGEHTSTDGFRIVSCSFPIFAPYRRQHDSHGRAWQRAAVKRREMQLFRRWKRRYGRELLAYSMPITRIIEENALKDMLEIEDARFLAYIEEVRLCPTSVA